MNKKKLRLLVIGCIESGNILNLNDIINIDIINSFQLNLRIDNIITSYKTVSPTINSNLSYTLSLSRVSGQNKAKSILQEAFLWPRLKPEIYHNMNVTIPVGVLMYGPPGKYHNRTIFYYIIHIITIFIILYIL